MVIFPVSRGKNRISQGVEDWGSLISVPYALRVFFRKPPRLGDTDEGFMEACARNLPDPRYLDFQRPRRRKLARRLF